MVPLLFMWAALLLAILGCIGESRGQAADMAEYKAYQQGCEKVGRPYKCFELRKEGKKIAKGFLIDGSETHVALFDVDQKKVRMLERAGLELISDPSSRK